MLPTVVIPPVCWVHNKNDLYHIKSIHRKFGKVPLKTFPRLGFIRKKYFEKTGKIKIIPLLNFVKYNKAQAIAEMTHNFGWQYPGGKHFESLFTRLYKTYILPVKIGLDKRKAHNSNLIHSGQATRDEALTKLALPPISVSRLETDKQASLQKLAIDEKVFNE